MSRPLSATVYGKYDMPSLRLYERIAQGLISACRKHVVAATRPSPFKVEDNQRPERTMSGVRKPSPKSSVPGETLTGFPSRQPSTRDGRLSHPPHHTGRVLQTSVKSNLRPSSPDNPPQTVHKCRNRGKAPIRQCRTTDDGGCTRFPSPCSGIPNIRIHREYAPYKR